LTGEFGLVKLFPPSSCNLYAVARIASISGVKLNGKRELSVGTEKNHAWTVRASDPPYLLLLRGLITLDLALAPLDYSRN
jgi:hypothetical protein